MARRLDKRRLIARFHSGSSPSAGFLNGMHQIGPFSGSLASRLCRLREVLKQMDVQHGLQGNAATAPGGRGVDGSIAESSRCQGIMASISSKNGSLQVFLLRFIRCASVRPKCFIGPRLWFRGDQ